MIKNELDMVLQTHTLLIIVTYELGHNCDTMVSMDTNVFFSNWLRKAEQF